MRLIGELKYFLSNEVVTMVANASIGGPVIRRMFRASHTLSLDAHVAILAEAAALVPILVESTDGGNEGVASLGGAVIDLFSGATIANSLDEIEAKSTNTSLFSVRVDLVVTADNKDA